MKIMCLCYAFDMFKFHFYFETNFNKVYGICENIVDDSKIKHLFVIHLYVNQFQIMSLANLYVQGVEILQANDLGWFL